MTARVNWLLFDDPHINISLKFIIKYSLKVSESSFPVPVRFGQGADVRTLSHAGTGQVIVQKMNYSSRIYKFCSNFLNRTANNREQGTDYEKFLFIETEIPALPGIDYSNLGINPRNFQKSLEVVLDHIFVDGIVNFGRIAALLKFCLDLDTHFSEKDWYRRNVTVLVMSNALHHIRFNPDTFEIPPVI